MINGLGLIKSLLVFRSFRFLLDDRRALGVTMLWEVMGSEVQRTKGVYGNLAIEPKTIETNRGDLLAILIEDANLPWTGDRVSMCRDRNASIICPAPKARQKKKQVYAQECLPCCWWCWRKEEELRIGFRNWKEFYTQMALYF
jgi:hypothetical protein